MPTRPTGPVLRLVRGTVTATAATGIAAAGHLAAGGTLFSPEYVAVLWLAVTAVAVAASGRRWSVGSLVTLLLGAQVVFHLGFALGGPWVGADTGMGDMPGMTHSGRPTVAMVAAHLAAALLTALLLKTGEDGCWALLGLLAAPLRGALLPVAPPAHPATPAPLGRVETLRHVVGLGREHPRRGPPAPWLAVPHLLHRSATAFA